MLIAHLPAGYILSALSYRYVESRGINRKLYLRVGMLGAIAPDLDMIYFYGIDHCAHSHHSYFSHFPMVWLLLLLSAWVCLHCQRRKTWPRLITIFAANGMLHMLLDYSVSNIYWLAPFVVKPFSLIVVESVFEPRWLNFLWHRSFLLELAIVAWAIWLWRRPKHAPVAADNRRFDRRTEKKPAHGRISIPLE